MKHLIQENLSKNEKLRRFTLFSIVFLILLEIAIGYEKTVKVEDFEDLQFKISDLKFNNFSLHLENALLSNTKNLKLSYSCRNKGEDKNFSASFVGLDAKGKIVFAIDASPSFWTQAKGSSTNEGEVYAIGNELKRTKFVWVKVVGI